MLKTKITNKVTRKRFYDFLRECNRNDHPNSTEISYIIQKLDLHNVSQIIFDYGEDNLRCILKYFEDIEYYEFCAIIRDKVAVHNKALRTDIKL